MLKRLRIKNFRLLRDVDIDLDVFPKPVVLVGPNASGKSTVLEVLDFLSRAVINGLQSAATAHGGIGTFSTFGVSDPVEIETTWRVVYHLGTPKERKYVLEWRLSLAPARSGAVLVKSESLIDRAGTVPRELITTAEDGTRFVHAEGDDTSKSSAIKSNHKLAVEEISDADRYPTMHNLTGLVGGIRILGGLASAPAWARAATASPSPRDSLVIGPVNFLDRQGIGLANVLYGLYTDHAETWSELEQAFRSEFPFVRRIVFPADAGGSKISFAMEDNRFSNAKIYASEMSDGMVSFLCLLAAVVHRGAYGLLGLDEPDSNLHPSALRRVMALAHEEKYLTRRALIIVTHSNALLEELRDPAKSIRIVDTGKNGAQIRKLDPDALDAWRKEYSLSDLRRTGLVDSTNGAQEPEL